MLHRRPQLRTVCAASLALAALFACASQPPPPDWLQGSSPRHPSDRWVVGVGVSEDTDQATEEALLSIREQVRDETEGATVADTWVDPESGMHWVLAVLDKQAVVERLQAELAGIDARITARRNAADGADPEAALASLAAAIELLDERDVLLARIRHFGGEPTQSAADAALTAAELREAFSRTRRALRIEISAWEMDPKTGDAGEPLDEDRRALARKALELGFSVDAREVAWGTDAVWLRVESKVALARLQLHPRDELVAVHWDAAVEITDVAGGGDVVAVLTDEGRSTHLNEREARRLANADARAFAVAALERWLRTRVAEPAAHR